MKTPRCATYDNPHTMQRECYTDGKLLCSYTAEVLLAKVPIPPQHFFFGANIGPWEPGRLVGNPDALPEGLDA